MVGAYIYIYYIDSNICHGNIIEKPSGNVGTRTCIAGISSQQRCYIPLTIIHPKKGYIKLGVKQPCLFPFVLVNSHIITGGV